VNCAIGSHLGVVLSAFAAGLNFGAALWDIEAGR